MSVFTRANRRLFRAGRNLLGRARDSRRVTFLPAEQSSDLTRILSGFNLEQLRPLARQLRGVSNLWIDHYFDLLGSGWTKVEHGMRCRGLEGHQYSSGARPQIDAEGRWLRGRITPANLDESTRVWRAVDRGVQSHRLATRLQVGIPLVRENMARRYQVWPCGRSRCQSTVGTCPHAALTSACACLFSGGEWRKRIPVA